MFLERLMMYVIFWKSPSFFLGPTHTAPLDSAKPYQKFVLSVKWQRGSLSNIIKVHFTPLHTKRWVLYLDRDTSIVLNSDFYKKFIRDMCRFQLDFGSMYKPR